MRLEIFRRNGEYFQKYFLKIDESLLKWKKEKNKELKKGEKNDLK